jgi:simple sugar transport system ATP-binding protein
VLRRGRNVATVSTAATSERELARLMIGHDLPRVEAGPAPPAHEPVLETVGVEADDDRGLRALRGVDLTVRSGEIVGVAGVAGNGQRELAEVVVGLRPPRAGTIRFRGADATRWSVGQRIAAGIGYSPEDRLRDGLAPSLSLVDNLMAKSYRTPPAGGRIFVHRREARRLAAALVERYGVRGAGLGAPASSLSGGNAQKLLLARELAADPWLLVAAQPTRGLDLGATEAARELLLDLRGRGKAILLVSEDLDELVTLCDRIVVLYAGRLTGEFGRGEADEERLGLAMAGRKT